MKAITLKSLVAISVLLHSATLAPPAMAVSGDVERFHACKQLKANGRLAWYGIATGTIEEGLADNPLNRNFHVKACFQTQQACNHWKHRIWWEIKFLDELRNVFCKPA